MIMGNKQIEGQAVEEILGYLGKRKQLAKKKYRLFVEEGINQEHRNDLIGGGLRRSQRAVEYGRRLESYDDRVLVSTEFVEYLRNDKKLHDKLTMEISMNVLL